MTSAPKDFGAGTGTKRKDPIEFRLYGQKFTARPEIQGKVLINLVKLSQSDAPADSAGVILDFFNQTLVAESKERFDALLEDPDKIVTVDKLGEIVGWMVEEYTNRPESPAED